MTGREDQALAEYAAIKAEQSARIIARDGLILGTIGAVGVIAGVARGGAALLLIPAVCYVTGWTYLANDHMVSAIGRYFRSHPALDAGWEAGHPADRRRRQRKLIQLSVDLGMFPGAGGCALAGWWAGPGPHNPVLLAGSVVLAAAMGVLAWQITAYAEVADTPTVADGAMPGRPEK